MLHELCCVFLSFSHTHTHSNTQQNGSTDSVFRNAFYLSGRNYYKINKCLMWESPEGRKKDEWMAIQQQKKKLHNSGITQKRKIMNVSQLTAHHVQQTTCRGLTPLLLLFLSILFFIHVYNFFFSSLLWLFYLFFFFIYFCKCSATS